MYKIVLSAIQALDMSVASVESPIAKFIAGTIKFD